MAILLDGFLCEVEGLEVLTAVAVTLVDKSEQLLSVGVSIAVLLYELLNRQIASTNSDNDLVLLYLHEHPLLAILVDSFSFSFKFHIVPHLHWSSVDVLSKSSVH